MSKHKTSDAQTVLIAAEQLTMVPIDDLIPYANNAKKHGVISPGPATRWRRGPAYLTRHYAS